jgi:predicted nucleotidyltransferase
LKKYTAKETEQFLKTIDSFLSKEVEIIIIGGTAAALAYKVSMATQDIDTWNSTQGILTAHKKAKVKTKLDIPMGKFR